MLPNRRQQCHLVGKKGFDLVIHLEFFIMASWHLIQKGDDGVIRACVGDVSNLSVGVYHILTE